MANQLLTDGDTQVISDHLMECVSVSYRETDGEKSGFVYSFRLKSELDEERAEAAKAAEESEVNQTQTEEEA